MGLELAFENEGSSEQEHFRDRRPLRSRDSLAARGQPNDRSGSATTEAS
jgi:hypothetical protein